MRKDGWYWVRVNPDDDAEPAMWMYVIREWKIGGGGYRDDELCQIGPMIPMPPEMALEHPAAPDAADDAGFLNGFPSDFHDLTLS